MEMTQVEVKTRARAALAMGAATATSAAISPKKRRKIAINTNNNNVNSNTGKDLKFSASSFVHLKNLSNTVAPVTEESCSCPFSNESPASFCSSNGSVNRIIKFSDLEVESAQVETSTCNCGEQQQIRREMSLTSELRTNLQEVESVEKKKKPTTVLSTPQKMPTESELEEFFAATEKDFQKRFSDRYNYDIVKDVPLKGRYEWVQLKP